MVIKNTIIYCGLRQFKYRHALGGGGKGGPVHASRKVKGRDTQKRAGDRPPRDGGCLWGWGGHAASLGGAGDVLSVTGATGGGKGGPAPPQLNGGEAGDSLPFWGELGTPCSFMGELGTPYSFMGGLGILCPSWGDWRPPAPLSEGLGTPCSFMGGLGTPAPFFGEGVAGYGPQHRWRMRMSQDGTLRGFGWGGIHHAPPPPPQDPPKR